jgi:phosphatidylserine/phosphatidylglycerophosphate/cardiolipin synthase-like enzyme
VLDGTVLWTGSTNFTDTGLTLNANNSLVISDTFLSGVYTREFDEMWSGAFHESKADNTIHLVQYDDAVVESTFSPTDLTAFEVWSELADADETIHLTMFFWTDELLSKRVVERIGAGVNDENTLIIHDRELARAYYAEWQRLWETVPVGRVCNALRSQAGMPTIVVEGPPIRVEPKETAGEKAYRGCSQSIPNRAHHRAHQGKPA